MKKEKTNEQMMRSLLKELPPIMVALLRERIVKICEISAEQCMEWENPIVHPSLYLELNELVQKHLGFNNK